MKKYVVTIIIALVCASACEAQINSQKVLRILDAHTEAMGGIERLRSLNTLKYKTQDTNDASGYHEIWYFDRNGAVRNDRVSLSSRKGTYSIVVSSTDAWEGRTSDDTTVPVSVVDMTDIIGPRGEPADRVDWFKQRISDMFVTFLDRIDRGYQYELLGRRNGPTGVEYVIKEIWPTGIEREIYINRETHLLSCLQQQPVRDPRHGAHNNEHCYIDYKLTDGYLLPTVVTRTVSGGAGVYSANIEVMDYKINPNFPATLFERPTGTDFGSGEKK